MTAPDLARAVELVRALLGDAPADEVECEVTRHGTIKIRATRAQATAQTTLRSGLERRK